jgi:hypothetical protein
LPYYFAIFGYFLTSSKAATAASKVLGDGRTSKASKSAAGSTLAQKGKIIHLF